MSSFDKNEIVLQVFESVEFEEAEKLCAFLGENICLKYSRLIPLLWLCSYRLQTFKRYGSTDMMFNGENNSTKAIIIKNCLYPLQRVCNSMFCKSKADEIMLSPTVFRSDRYTELLKQMNEKYNIVKTATANDIEISGVKNLKKYLCENFFGNKRYITGFAVCSAKLRKSISCWLQYCLEMENMGVTSVVDDATAVAMLDEMQNEFLKLVAKAKNALSKSNVTQYITVNQYNIRDLILITACSELGIRTKQYEHHASRVMHNVIDKKRVARYAFVDDICCWNNAESDFHKNVYQYKNVLTGNEVNIYPVGNPEILIDTAKDAIVKYPEENRVTFMVSGMANVMDPEAVAKDLAFRKSIFEGLKKLSDKQGVKILVRYPPGINMEYRKEEEPYLKELGFEISLSTRENLMEDICKSFAVFGTLSSTIGLSALMGKQVYQIAQEGVQYYLTDKNIYTVHVEDIENIVFDRTQIGLNPDDFMDFEKLFRV